MCCDNSNQKTLNEVMSQMTALTNAVDKLRSEVNAIKVKSHLIQTERTNNESARRAIIIRKCGNKNCIAFRKLGEYNRIGRAMRGDCRVNVDRHPTDNGKVHSQTPRSKVSDFGVDSSRNTVHSKSSSSSYSRSEESLSTVSSSGLESESSKESKFRTARSQQTADRRLGRPTAIPQSIGNASNNNERIGGTIKMNKENQKRQDKEPDVVAELSDSSETIDSNFLGRNTPIVAHIQVESKMKRSRTKEIVANKKNPKSKTEKSDSGHTGAVHDTDKFGATVQKEKNRSVKAKMSKSKFMQVVRRKIKQNDTVGVKHVSEDRENKSNELSHASLNSNENEDTPACMRCLLLCSLLKKTVSQKLNTKNQSSEQRQVSGAIPARTEAEGLVQEPNETVIEKGNKSTMTAKNKQRVNVTVQSPRNAVEPSDIGDVKLTGLANKRRSKNRTVEKSQSSSTVDTEANSSEEKPIRNVNKRVRRKKKKLNNKKTVQSPSSSVNTPDIQSISSAEKIATTGNNTRKKRRTRNRKKMLQQVPVGIQSSNATYRNTESFSNLIEYNGTKTGNENKTKDKGTAVIFPKTTDEDVGIAQIVPERIAHERAQPREESVDATKWMESVLSVDPHREIPKTIKLSHAAVGTTGEIPKSKSHAEDRNSEGSLSVENSTTLDSSSEEHFENSATNPIRKWTSKEQLYGELPGVGKLLEIWCPDQEHTPHVCRCRRNAKHQYKMWLLIPFKNKERSKRCDPCTPCEKCYLQRTPQDVKSSSRSNDFQDHAKPTFREFTASSERYPTFHQDRFENYQVASSIPSTAMERPYLFSNPTSPGNHCPNTKPDQNDGAAHHRHQQLILNNSRKFDPESRMSRGANQATLQCNPVATMGISGSLTPKNANNILGSHASDVRSEEHRLSVCNDPNFLVPSCPSNYLLQNSPAHGFQRFEATESQFESRKPALFQRVANYFFSRKSSEYAYDSSRQIAGYQSDVKLPGEYNIHSSSPSSLRTPQPYAHNGSDPLSRYEVLTETQRVSHNFDQPRSVYTIMSTHMPQPHILWRKF